MESPVWYMIYDTEWEEDKERNLRTVKEWAEKENSTKKSGRRNIRGQGSHRSPKKEYF